VSPVGGSRSGGIFGEERDAGGAGHEGFGGEVEKKAVLDDADDVVEAIGDLFGSFHGAKRAIHDVVAAVGDVGLPVAPSAQRGASAKRLELSLGGFPSEGDDFDGYGNERSEAINNFGVVGDDRHTLAARGNDLFAQERSAVALDEEERAGDNFVGAVNREIELRFVGERRQRDIQRVCLLLGMQGRGHANDSQPLFGNAVCQRVDEQSGGGARAQAEHHSVFDQLDGRFGSGFLPLILFGERHRCPFTSPSRIIAASRGPAKRDKTGKRVRWLAGAELQ